MASYTDAVSGMAERQDEAIALLHALSRQGDTHTALLIAVLVLAVGLALAVGALALLARDWGRRALADHAELMLEARRPTAEQMGISHAISDLDDATGAITAIRDELVLMRALAERYLGRAVEEITLTGEDRR